MKKVFCFLLMSQFYGCIGMQIGFQSHPQQVGGYSIGEKYKLKVPVFLASIDDGLPGERYVLLPDSRKQNPWRLYNAPMTIEEFYSTNGGSNGNRSAENTLNSPTSAIHLVDVIPNGTIVECIELRKYFGFNWWEGFYVTYYTFAKILSGKHAGLISDLGELSLRNSNLEKDIHQMIGKPNPELLSSFNDNAN